MGIQNPDGDDCSGADCIFLDVTSGVTWDVSGFESNVDVGGNSNKLCVKMQNENGKIKAENCDSNKYAVCQLDCSIAGS